MDVTLLQFLMAVSVGLGTIVLVYFTAGLLAFLAYAPGRADAPAENVEFTIVTIGSDAVAATLREGIRYHREMLPDYQLNVLTDAGCDVEGELQALEGINTIVVPDSFTCEATNKGRALEYFVREHVDASGETWYAFLDDDNRLLSDDILYEIPVYEKRGYRAANPVLYPREGGSTFAFVVDHIRTVEDLTSFRFFTGALGRPYMGFHGELTTVRGDTLARVGFNRESLVEDYAFARNLVSSGVKTWQTRSGISILSPHSVADLFKQRRRWYIGLCNEQFREPYVMTLTMGVRLVTWTFGLVGGITFAPVWGLAMFGVIPPIDVPMALRLGLGALAVTNIGACLLGAWRLDAAPLTRVKHAVLTPVYLGVEALTPVYSWLTWHDVAGFEVIKK